jgi:hypothetical protein
MKRFCLAFLLITGCGDGDERDYSGSCPEGSECNIKGTALVFRVRPPFSSFFNRPWPADVRMTAGGTVDLSGFPHMEPGSMLEDWVTIIQQNTPGFGTNAAVYFSFDGPLDTNTLPLDPAETISGRPTAFLVDISAGPGRGEMIPLAVRFFKDRRQFTPKNTLVFRPVLGFPLRSSTTYAAVVTRGVSSESGSALGAVSDFERTKYESPPEAPDVRSWWEVMNPAYDELEELGLVKRGKVAALGVFTTQEVLDEMDRVREYIHAQPAPTVGNWRRRADQAGIYRFEGWFDLPEFQAGEPPDFEGGGAFVFDQNGVPVPQRTANIPFLLGVPTGTPPAGGWPLVIYAHGTGGTREGFCNNDGDPCVLMANVGIASIGIDQPLHGERNPWGSEPNLTTFNFYNILAMRDNFRQGAADLLVLRRLIDSLEVPAATSPTGSAIAFDQTRVGYMGHSQGGLSGGIYLGVAEGIEGAVMSGAGGGLGVALLEKTEPVDIPALLILAMDLEATEFDIDHPAINIFQMFSERADGLNYARRYLQEPHPGAAPRHLFFSEGMLDLYTIPIQTEALSAAGGCMLMTPVASAVEAMDLRGLTPLSPPVSGNAQGPNGEPVTAVLVQYPNNGHFAVFDNPTAKSHYTGFLDTLLHQDLPSVGP